MARDLTIRITADNADAVTKLGQTEKAITGVESSTGKANKGLEGLAGAFGMAKKAIGVLGIGVTIFEFQSLAGQIQDTADKLGIGTDAIQRWKFAAEQTGGSLEGMTSAATMLYRNLAGGEKGVVSALEELGLKLADVRAMKPEQAFEEIADRVGRIPDPMKQVGLGAALMGRGFADNLPAMKQGLKALGDQAQELGLVMDEKAIKAGDAFGDTLDQLKGSFMSLIGTALTPILPILNELLQAVLPIVKVLAELLNLVLTPLGWVLQKVAEGIRWLVEKVTEAIKPTQWLKAAWEGVVSVFTVAKDAIVNAAKAIYEGVAFWLVEKFEWIVGKVKGAVGAVKGFFSDLYTAVVGGSYIPDMVTEIGQHIQRLDPLMVQPVDAMTKRTTSLFQTMTTSIDNVFTEWSNKLGDWVQTAVPGLLGQGMAGVASGILNGVMGLFTGGLNKLVQMGVDLAWKGLKKLGSMIAGLFRGEGAKTNDVRDEWMAGLGGLSGAHGLIAGFGNDWTLLNAFEQAYRASSRDDLMRWIEVFERRLMELQGGAAPNPNAPAPGGGAGGGLGDPRLPEGGGSTYVFNNPQFSDRASIDDLTRRVGNAIMADLTMRMRLAQ